ncbi:MAG: NUDIX domain-containing protein [bacterium]
MENFLNIIDENGNILGKETRSKIHEDGLLHMEAHVWFVTSSGELIFQHRGKNKDTCPDLLDVTVAGHVEIGSNYEETALKETEEETGNKINIKDLLFLGKVKTKTIDEVKNKINYSIRAVYVYKYLGKVKNLKVEESKNLGFEVWSIIKLLNLTNEEKSKFTPTMVDVDAIKIYEKIQSLYNF